MGALGDAAAGFARSISLWLSAQSEVRSSVQTDPVWYGAIAPTPATVLEKLGTALRSLILPSELFMGMLFFWR
jgi:hypothetical protein